MNVHCGVLFAALLDADHLLNARQKFRMRQTEVIVSLPKFKLEQKLHLNSVLTSLGMLDAFKEVRALNACDYLIVYSNDFKHISCL